MMSAPEKSKSIALIVCQSRNAVIEVRVAPSNHGVFQLSSAEIPLSLTSCSVLRLL